MPSKALLSYELLRREAYPAWYNRLAVRRCLAFVFFFFLSAILFRKSLVHLLSLASSEEQWTYTLFVPVISFGFLCLNGRRIVSEARYAPALGIPVIASGALIFFGLSTAEAQLGSAERLIPAITALVLVWIGGFLLLFGGCSFRESLFSWAMLILFIPPPASWIHFAVTALQKASADWTYALLQLTAMPVFREGMKFSLPGAVIEVAEQCSGIRASTALILTAIVLGRLFLRSVSARLSLVLFAVPLAILKNAVRIALISLLGVYVSPDYFSGNLHRQGGPLFLTFALALLIPFLLGLQRWESVGRRPLSVKPTRTDRTG